MAAFGHNRTSLRFYRADMSVAISYARRQFLKRMGIYVPTIYAAGVHGSVHLSHLDHEVYLWMNAVRGNGGNYTGVSVVANDAFLKRVRSAGLRSKVYRVNTYTGLDLLACEVPLLPDSGGALDQQTGFVAADYTEATGLTGNLLNKQNNCGFNPSTSLASTDDSGFGFYVRTNVQEAGVSMGCAQPGGGGGSFYMYCRYGSGNPDGTVGVIGPDGGAATLASDTTALGLYHLSRTSSTSLTLYKNGSSVATNATPSTSPMPNGVVTTHAYNYTTIGVLQYSAKTLAGYFIVKGMDATQAAAWYQAWQRLQTILGRQV